MREYITHNLVISYNVIKYIHQLYIKYKKYIKFTTFRYTGVGIDTIYNIDQIKDPNIFILQCKVIYYKEYIVLPIKIITIFGIWTFIDEPFIIDIHKNIIEIKNFMLELNNKLNLKFLFPGFYDENGQIYNPMFLITKFNNYIYNSHYINDIKIDTNIYEYDIIKNKLLDFRNIFFNEYPYGPNIIEYEFNNIIKFLYQLKKIDDKLCYFYQYDLIQKNIRDNYINNIKSHYNNRKIYGFQKNIYRMLFYYTYTDYVE